MLLNIIERLNNVLKTATVLLNIKMLHGVTELYPVLSIFIYTHPKVVPETFYYCTLYSRRTLVVLKWQRAQEVKPI